MVHLRKCNFRLGVPLKEIAPSNHADSSSRAGMALLLVRITHKVLHPLTAVPRSE